MNNRWNALILFLVMTVVPVAAQAQGKVGVINFSVALGSTQEGKKALADLQAKYLPRQQELQRLQQEIQQIQDQLNKQSATLSEDEQRRLQRELEDKQKELKRSTDDAQSDYAADRDEAIRRLGEKMVKVIGQYAQQNGFVLVLDDAQIPVYYAAKQIDISTEMVKLYDAANPVGAAGATAAPKPAAKNP